MTKPPRNRKHTRFDFLYITSVRLPVEWQDQLDKEYKKFALRQVEQGKQPKKTDFVRFVFQEFLKRNNYSK